MANENFQKTIIVNASAEEAMKKISEVKQWWAKKVKGKTANMNDRFRVDFGKTFVDFQITVLIPGKKVVWKVTGCNLHWINNKKEWNNTEVVFELSEKNKQTKIAFTHIGLVPGAECYDDCKSGWSEHIGESLAKFINEGKGMPV